MNSPCHPTRFPASNRTSNLCSYRLHCGASPHSQVIPSLSQARVWSRSQRAAGAQLPVGLDLRGGGQHRVRLGGIGGGQDAGLLIDDLGVNRVDRPRAQRRERDRQSARVLLLTAPN